MVPDYTVLLTKSKKGFNFKLLVATVKFDLYLKNIIF